MTDSIPELKTNGDAEEKDFSCQVDHCGLVLVDPET